MRPYEVGTAAVFALLAGVAMFDSRRGALVGSANDPGGIGSGFYPFWSAGLVAVAALLLAYRYATRPQPAQGVFEGRQSILAVLKLVLPMVAFAASIGWLGFYLAIAAYMGFFARYIGRYRWLAVLATAIGFPVIMYLAFERGFRLVLPKSILYGDVFPL